MKLDQLVTKVQAALKVHKVTYRNNKRVLHLENHLVVMALETQLGEDGTEREVVVVEAHDDEGRDAFMEQEIYDLL